VRRRPLVGEWLQKRDPIPEPRGSQVWLRRCESDECIGGIGGSVDRPARRAGDTLLFLTRPNPSWRNSSRGPGVVPFGLWKHVSDTSSIDALGP
jgi:hypothetical protein